MHRGQIRPGLSEPGPGIPTLRVWIAFCMHYAPGESHSMDIASLRKKLEPIGQSHVLRFFEKLDADGRRRLLAQIEALDGRLISELAEGYVRSKPVVQLPNSI